MFGAGGREARRSQWERWALSSPAAGVDWQLAGRGRWAWPPLGLRATPAGEAPKEVVTPESCGSGCACFPPYPELGAQVSCAHPSTHCSFAGSHLLRSRMLPAERSAVCERARSGEGVPGPVKSAVSRPAGSALGGCGAPERCGPTAAEACARRPAGLADLWVGTAEFQAARHLRGDPGGRGSRPAGVVAPPGSLVVPPPLLFLPLSTSRPPQAACSFLVIISVTP